MAKQESEMKPRKQDADRDEVDYEQFLRDLEADPELREGLKLYREGGPQRNGVVGPQEDMETDGEEDEGLEIPMEQLIDEMEDVGLEDGEE